MMDILRNTELTEKLQELLDRRGRILQDLEAVDAEIRRAYAELMGGEPTAQKALPPAGARSTTATPGAPKNIDRLRLWEKKRSKSESTDGGKSLRDQLIEYVETLPKGVEFKAADVATELSITRAQASNMLAQMSNDAKGVRWVKRGVYKSR